MTDLRQGITKGAHAVLDELETWGHRIGAETTIPILALNDAKRSLSAAIRADPQTGMDKRRILMAREAAAQIILALDGMDENGRWNEQGKVE